MRSHCSLQPLCLSRSPSLASHAACCLLNSTEIMSGCDSFRPSTRVPAVTGRSGVRASCDRRSVFSVVGLRLQVIGLLRPSSLEKQPAILGTQGTRGKQGMQFKLDVCPHTHTCLMQPREIYCLCVHPASLLLSSTAQITDRLLASRQQPSL